MYTAAAGSESHNHDYFHLSYLGRAAPRAQLLLQDPTVGDGGVRGCGNPRLMSELEMRRRKAKGTSTSTKGSTLG